MAHAFARQLQDEESIYLKDLLQVVNEGLPVAELFGSAEAEAACNEMERTNDLMISDGMVYRI